jgi:nucleoside phosphorylase/CheY-like chemotaxis protein
MEILLIEDSQKKIAAINEVLNSNLEYGQLKLRVVRSLNEARRCILCAKYDLIIFDIYLPVSDAEGDTAVDVSSELIDEFSVSKNYLTESLVITQYPLDEIDSLHQFNANGVTVVAYSESDKRWIHSLEIKLSRIKRNVKYEFLIFCALTKERDAYSKTNASVGEGIILKGLDCKEIEISDHFGLIITPPKMGLVNMAITASKAIEYFQPKIVAMSGICAGVKGNSSYLDLIIPERCWEYQTGKFIDGEFKQEPYHSAMNSQLFLELRQFYSNSKLREMLGEGLSESEVGSFRIVSGPMSSGSAVIADENKMKEVEEQHRKMVGLEMEMYSLYEAAHQSLCSPLCFGVKSVVDMGDSSKGSGFHSSASILSARFVVGFLGQKLNNIDETECL